MPQAVPGPDSEEEEGDATCEQTKFAQGPGPPRDGRDRREAAGTQSQKQDRHTLDNHVYEVRQRAVSSRLQSYGGLAGLCAESTMGCAPPEPPVMSPYR